MAKNVSTFRRIVTPLLGSGARCSAFIVSASSALRRSCWPRQAQRLMPEAAVVVVAEVAAVGRGGGGFSRRWLFAGRRFSVAAGFRGRGRGWGMGWLRRTGAAITAIAGVG